MTWATRFPVHKSDENPAAFAPFARTRTSAFFCFLESLGGRPLAGFVRNASSPWRRTTFFHRRTDAGDTFNARTTSMFFLPASRRRPAAKRRASCSSLLPSVLFMHFHTQQHAHGFSTFAKVNNTCATARGRPPRADGWPVRRRGTRSSSGRKRACGPGRSRYWRRGRRCATGRPRRRPPADCPAT